MRKAKAPRDGQDLLHLVPSLQQREQRADQALPFSALALRGPPQHHRRSPTPGSQGAVRREPPVHRHRAEQVRVQRALVRQGKAIRQGLPQNQVPQQGDRKERPPALVPGNSRPHGKRHPDCRRLHLQVPVNPA